MKIDRTDFVSCQVDWCLEGVLNDLWCRSLGMVQGKGLEPFGMQPHWNFLTTDGSVGSSCILKASASSSCFTHILLHVFSSIFGSWPSKLPFAWALAPSAQAGGGGAKREGEWTLPRDRSRIGGRGLKLYLSRSYLYMTTALKPPSVIVKA